MARPASPYASAPALGAKGQAWLQVRRGGGGGSGGGGGRAHIRHHSGGGYRHHGGYKGGGQHHGDGGRIIGRERVRGTARHSPFTGQVPRGLSIGRLTPSHFLQARGPAPVLLLIGRAPPPRLQAAELRWRLAPRLPAAVLLVASRRSDRSWGSDWMGHGRVGICLGGLASLRRLLLVLYRCKSTPRFVGRVPVGRHCRTSGSSASAASRINRAARGGPQRRDRDNSTVCDPAWRCELGILNCWGIWVKGLGDVLTCFLGLVTTVLVESAMAACVIGRADR